MRLIAWVLMPDHAHWLVQLGANVRLDDVVTRLKSGSARRANGVRGLRGRVWAPGYYDHCLRDESELLDTARYICANPVRAGITTSIRHYPFWNTIYL
jgi:REP element-mobilizing transposase RayT